MAILVAKADGLTEPFDEKKLLGSLEHAGAEKSSAQEIAAFVKKNLYSGITTHEIYRRAFAHLRSHRRAAAARYSLKRAVQEFGPSGFPFEAFLSELFRAEGWETQIDQLVKGACVEHEVDIVMHEGGERVYVEAKFHNTPGFKTDLKVVLYVKARVDDIAARPRPQGGVVRAMVATNTKFTSQAAAYAECQNLELLSWDDPAGHSLHERIEKAHIYPITALTTLSRQEKTSLLAERVVLCRRLAHHEDALARAGVPRRRMQEILEEAGALCSS